jgi:DNA-binding transcriptional MerR regulator
MILILRGKRLGFSLREIKDYLDLYDADPRQLTQTRALLARIAERRRTLEDRRDAIEQALRGLDDLERDASAILAKAEMRRDKTKSATPRQ